MFEVVNYAANANHRLDNFLIDIEKSFAKINQVLVPLLPLQKNINAIVNDAMLSSILLDVGIGGDVLRPDLFVAIIDTSRDKSPNFAQNFELILAIETFRATREQTDPQLPQTLIEDILNEGLAMLFVLAYAKSQKLPLLPVDQKILELAEDNKKIKHIKNQLQPKFHSQNYPEEIFLDGENSLGLPERSGQALGLNLVRQHFREPDFSKEFLTKISKANFKELSREF